jgi:hypothetical protein
MLREFFEKRRIRKLFSSYIKAEDLERILNEPAPDQSALCEATIEFICVSVRGETPQIVSERMGLVTEIASQHGGCVTDMVSGIVVITYGMVTFESDIQPDPLGLRETLRTQLANNIKIVHRKARGHLGNLGSKYRQSFSFIVPGFLDALSVLAALSYGETRELEAQ